MNDQPRPGDLVVLRAFPGDSEPSPASPSYVGPFRVHEIDPRTHNLVGDYTEAPACCTSRAEALHAIAMAKNLVARENGTLPESVSVYDAPGYLTAVVGSDEDKRLADIQADVRESMRDHFKRRH